MKMGKVFLFHGSSLRIHRHTGIKDTQELRSHGPGTYRICGQMSFRDTQNTEKHETIGHMESRHKKDPGTQRTQGHTEPIQSQESRTHRFQGHT